MKKIFFITVVFSMYSLLIVAQSVGINNNTPHASAILDVKSFTKGMLIPRTSTTSRLAIVDPAKGLIIYDTTTSGFWFHNGTEWAQLSAANNSWSLTGNSGTNAATHFIGTTDDQPLVFKIGNIKSGIIDSISGNTALGYTSLFSNTTGYDNVASGYAALYYNTTGFANTANGFQALAFNNTGIFNTASGNDALYSNIDGSRNTATGAFALALNTTGNRNTATGTDALYYNTSGYDNTATGASALVRNTTGHHNTALGGSALFYNTTGSYNTANGYTALYANTSGSSNIANGYGALSSNTSGSYNTASGANALYTNSTGNNNSAYGALALYNNNTGKDNIAMGYSVLVSNTTGSSNTASGEYALSTNITGNNNTAIGFAALGYNQGGNNNVAIGSNSGIHPSTPNIYNTVSIGNDDLLNAYQNQVIIGNTSTGFIGGKVNWGIVSDARIKNTVMEDVKGLDFILRLRPVTYHISNKAMTTITGNKEMPDFPGKYDVEKIKYSGFIAQEVEQAAKDSKYEFSGYDAPKNQWSLYTLKYAEFVVPLVKAMQEQQAIITNQQQQIDLLEKRLAALEAKK